MNHPEFILIYNKNRDILIIHYILHLNELKKKKTNPSTFLVDILPESQIGLGKCIDT